MQHERGVNYDRILPRILRMKISISTRSVLLGSVQREADQGNNRLTVGRG